MCIRSQHGDITAWCATFESDITPRTSPSTTTSKNKTTHANHNSKNFNFSHTSSTRTFRFPSSLRVHKNIAICLLLTTSFLVLPDEVDSAVMFPRKSIANYEDFQYLPLPASVTKPINRKRLKRSSVDRPMRNPWSADLVTYVCDELKDPCTRAKFLRLHTYHDICSDLPPLYLLPHVDNEQLIQNYSSVKLCSASDKGWRSTDGLYRGYLETSESCRNNLNALDLLIRSSLKGDLDMFVDILEHSFCTIPANNSLLEECAQCQRAYWAWVCTVTFPIYYPLSILPPLNESDAPLASPSPRDITHVPNATTTTTTPPKNSSIIISRKPNRIEINDGDHMETSSPRASSTSPPPRLKSPAPGYSLRLVQPCMTWCTQVETVCPYHNPGDFTSNGGEPTFLCDESHYYRESTQKNIRTIDKYTGCEHDCCFTEDDLLLDAIIVASPSTSKDGGKTESPQIPLPREQEYFSLTARCLQEELSSRLAVSSDSTSFANYTATSSVPSQEPRASSTSGSRKANAFLPLILLLPSILAAIRN